MEDVQQNAQKCPEGNTISSGLTTDTRVRSYCFTINNWTESEWENCKLVKGCTYGCIAPEFAPSTGTPHIQGYLYFANKKAFSALKKALPRANISIANGTALQNRTYIFGPYEKDGKTKDFNDKAIEWGDMPKQGERVDLDAIKSEICEGKSVDDICMENPIVFHQYGRTLERIELIAMRKKFRTEMTQGIWLYGETGVGKSHKAFENYSPETHYVWNFNDGGFWQDYRQQDTVIIQELRGEIPFGFLLELVDKWPMNVKIKGKNCVPFTSKKVIITSSMHPKDIYKKSLENDDKMAQLYRRFDIEHLTK